MKVVVDLEMEEEQQPLKAKQFKGVEFICL